MKTRKSIPNNNDYYIRQVNGGLNGAVQGYPTISGANVLCNCVGYANGRFNEIINDPNLKGIEIKFQYQLVCNAENFIESAKKQGLKISSKPTLGGIMVWQKGATLGGGDGAGHVAVVEEIYKDGSILTSESGYGSRDWAFKNLHRNNSNGRWGQAAAYKFRGCIINPSVKSEVKGTYKLTVDGIGGTETVMRMQEFFSMAVMDGVISGQSLALQKKYYPSLIAVKSGTDGSVTIKALQKWIGTTQDGILGQATVKAWQKKLGLTVSGVFDADNMKAWQKYLNEHETPDTPTPTQTHSKGSYKGRYPNLKVIRDTEHVIGNTLNFAKWIAGDNLFHYGCGTHAHHNGCYFCNTQPASKKNSGIKDWQRTYCCNPFVHACWAHGGLVPTALSMCEKGRSWGFKKGEGYDASKLFKRVNRSDARPGDVFCSDGHVALFIGNGKIIHAGHEDDNRPNSESWNTSIAVGEWKDKYYDPPRVYRFIGSVDANIFMRKGEVSGRVKDLQDYLKWYFDKEISDKYGYFGDITDKLLKMFQEAELGKAQADGIVGQKTIDAMKKVKK